MGLKDYLNWIITGIAGFFLIPSLLVIVSWNALPGERIYGLKTDLEDVAFLLIGKTPIASAYSVSLTERRSTEATKLLSKKGSTVGYTLLVEEAVVSKNVILNKSDTQNAAVLIQKIEEYQNQIEQEKTKIQGNQITAIAQKTEGTTQAPPTQAPVPAGTAPAAKTPTSAKTPLPEIVAETENEALSELEEVQEELEEIKIEIESKLPESASDKAKEVEQQNLIKKEDTNMDKSKDND